MTECDDGGRGYGNPFADSSDESDDEKVMQLLGSPTSDQPTTSYIDHSSASSDDDEVASLNTQSRRKKFFSRYNPKEVGIVALCMFSSNNRMSCRSELNSRYVRIPSKTMG